MTVIFVNSKSSSNIGKIRPIYTYGRVNEERERETGILMLEAGIPGLTDGYTTVDGGRLDPFKFSSSIQLNSSCRVFLSIQRGHTKDSIGERDLFGRGWTVWMLGRCNCDIFVVVANMTSAEYAITVLLYVELHSTV